MSVNKNIFKDEKKIDIEDYYKCSINEVYTDDEEQTICTIKYEIKDDDEEKIKILGEKFVNNNKNNCSIIHKKKVYKLSSYFNIKRISTDELIIKLLIFNSISNLSYMFNECSNIKSI